jgi:hypothetical protein
VGRACGAYGAEKKCMKVSVGKPEGKRPLRRCKHRWEDNVQMDPKRNRMGGYLLDSSGARYKELVGSCEHNNESSVSIKYMNIFD